MQVTCPNKNSPEWKRLVEGLGETEAYRLFMVFNDTLPEMNVIESVIARYGSSKEDILNIPGKKVNQKLNNFLMRYLTNLGIGFQQVSGLIETSQEGTQSVAIANVTKRLIQWARGGEYAIPEESAHMIIEMIADKTLVSNLINLAEKTDLYKEVYDAYFDLYQGDITKLKKETAGKLLSRELNNRSEVKSSTLKSILQKVIQLLRKIFSSGDLSFEQEFEKEFGSLANKILSGNTEGISVNNIISSMKQEELYSLASSDQDKTIEELKKLSSSIEKIDYEEEGKRMHRYEYQGTVLRNTSKVSEVKPFDLSESPEWLIELTEASQRSGIAVHGLIEDIINDFDNENKDLDSFLSNYDFAEKEVLTELYNFVDKLLKKARKEDPNVKFITENVIGNIRHKIGGTTDLIMVWSDGSITVYDWKTSSKSDISKNYKTYKLPSYERQQNIYRTIISTPQPELDYAGINVKSVYLVPIMIKLDKNKDKIKFVRARTPKQVQSRAQKDFITDLFGKKDRSAEGKLDTVINELISKLERKVDLYYRRGKRKEADEINKYTQNLRSYGNLDVLKKEFERYLGSLTLYLEGKKVKRNITDQELIDLDTLIKSLGGVEDDVIAIAGSKENLPAGLYDLIIKVQQNRISIKDQINDIMNLRAQEVLKNSSSNPELSEDLFHNSYDITVLSRWFGTAADSPNSIVALTDRILKRIDFDVNEEYKAVHQEVLEMVKDLIKETNERDPEKLFGRYIAKDKENKLTVYFINKFSYKFWEELYAKRKAVYSAETDADRELAVNELKKWQQENYQQKYTDEYFAMYKILDQLEDIDGVNYRTVFEDLRQDRYDILNKYEDEEELSDEDRILLEDIKFNMKQLETSHPKVRKIMKEFRKAFMARHEFTKSSKFEEVRRAKKSLLSPEEFKKWESKQYVTVYGQEYWDWVESINKKAKAGIDEAMKLATDSQKEILEKAKKAIDTGKALKKDIFFLYADSMGYVDGRIVSKTDRQKFLKAESAIRNAKGTIKDILGKDNDFFLAMKEFIEKSEIENNPYYDEFIAELKDKYGELYQESEEYKENHFLDLFTEEYVPISYWQRISSLLYSKEPQLIAAWDERKVKDEFINKEYQEDKFGNALPREKPQWIDPEYTKIMSLPDSSAVKRFYLKFTELMEKANDKIPTRRSLHAIPDVRKDGKINFKGGVKTTFKRMGQHIKDTYTLSMDDQKKLSEELADEADQIVYMLPLYFVGMPDKESVSYDLADSVLAYYKDAIAFEKKSNMEPAIKFILESVATTELNQKSVSGLPLLDKAASLIQGRDIPKTKEGAKSYMLERLNDLINLNYYETGDPQHYIKNVNLNAIADTMMKYNSLLYLSFNIFAGTANVTLGELTQAQEAFGGQFYTSKDYRKASGIYWKEVKGALNDLMEGKRSGKLSLINDFFDTMQDQDEYGKKTSEAHVWYKRMMSTDTLFFLNHAGEHKMQTTLLLAMLNSHAIEGNKIVRITDYNKQKSLYSIMSVKDGKLVFEKELTPDMKFEFREKVIAVSQRLQGIYMPKDKAAIQKYWAAQLVFQFKKFVLPGFRTRWQSAYFNERLQDTTEGYYLTVWKFLGRVLSDYKATAAIYKSLNPYEKSNMRKAGFEVVGLSLLLILGGVIANMRSGDEDREDSRTWNFVLYSIDRLATEYRFFNNYNDTIKVLRSPAATVTTLVTMTDAISQIFFFDLTDFPPHHNMFERYESGNNEGELKFISKTEKLIPLLNIFERILNLEDQVSYYRK